MDEWKRDTHIPAFGNWDLTNEFPITLYFECATQPRPLRNHIKEETRKKVERQCRHVNGKKGKVYDVRGNTTTFQQLRKPVDEDLYKIPPELVHTTNKRKKLVRFISKCLVLFVCYDHY